MSFKPPEWVGMPGTKFGRASFCRILELATLVAVVATWVYVLVRNVSATWEFTADDTYITLRYARNLVDGWGIVWNPGESPPVEGYSNFLFVVIGASAIASGLNAVALLKAFGVAGLVLGSGSAWFLARTFVGRIAAWIPALIVVSYPGSSYWAVSGLETTLYLGMVLTALALWVRGLGFQHDSTRGPARQLYLIGAFAAALLAALTRPEGAWLAVAMTFGMIAWKSWRETLRLTLKPVLAFALPYLIYMAWRFLHFGELLPHSVVCKAAFTGDPSILTRWYWGLAAPCALLSLALPWRNLDRRHIPLWLFPAGYMAILTGVDPIIGHWNRHALTPWSVLVVAGAIGLVRIAHMAMGGFGSLVSGLREALTAAGVAFWVVVIVPDPTGSLEREAAHYGRRMAAREALGDWLEQRATPDDWVAVGDCGMIPWRTHAKVFDVFCLNSREVSDPPVSFDAHRLAGLVFEKRPKFIVVHSRDPMQLVPRREYGFYDTLVARSELGRDYSHVVTVGAQGDDFHYWVFMRKQV
ncbi:MAG: hypothetical protein K8F56_06350 [Rhodocyclaceae bacterium]|nr:hypothetical protein [Rhodocyclaceae bacterium]